MVQTARKLTIPKEGIEVKRGDSFPEDRKVYVYHFREPAPMITLRPEEPHPTIEGRLLKEAYRIIPTRNFHVCTGSQEHKTDAKGEARLLWEDPRNWEIYHLQGGCDVCGKAEVYGQTGVVKVLTASQEKSNNENPRGWHVPRKPEYV